MSDREILRGLASRHYQYACSDENRENMLRHKRVNDLNGDRPIVLINEIPWQEMNANGELTLRCEDKQLQTAEQFFRRENFKWEHMRADMVLRPFFSVEKQISSTGNGVDVIYDDGGVHGGTVKCHTFQTQFKTVEDLEKLHFETIAYNEAATLRQYEMLGELLGDTIPVKITGVESGYETAFKIWDDISRYMSLDEILYGLIDNPDFMHGLAQRLTEIQLDVYRQYDEMGLWECGAFYNHSTAALTDELADNWEHPTRQNVWGRGIAQIFSTVSPDMQDEFDIFYQQKALAGFGLVYYGCCEPLHRKLHVVEKIPNLRKISITPWADVDVAAEIIGNRYVVASKPNPSLLSGGKLDEDAVRSELRRIIAACKRNGCSCDMTLKDITTVGGNPENLFRWEQIAMEMVRNY